MKKTSDPPDFEKLHEFDLSGLWNVYGKWIFLIKRSFVISFFLSAILTIIVACQNKPAKEVYDILTDNISLGIGLEGGLIGLSLAGLTLIVTFGSDSLMRHLVRSNIEKALKEKKELSYSAYQTAVSKFSFAVFIQILTLIVLLIVKVLAGLELCYYDDFYNELTNTLLLFVCLLLVFYSLMLVVQMTLNIFTISQMNHMVYFEEEAGKILNEEEE